MNDTGTAQDDSRLVLSVCCTFIFCGDIEKNRKKIELKISRERLQINQSFLHGVHLLLCVCVGMCVHVRVCMCMHAVLVFVYVCVHLVSLYV